MCGISVFRRIVGAELADELQYAWDAMIHRGVDSYGWFGITVDGRFMMDKALYSDKLLNRMKDKFGDVEFDVVVAHNRMASMGGVSVRFAHPVRVGNIVVVQNGTNRAMLNVVPWAKSDTEAIAHILAYRGNGFVRKYLEYWLMGSGVVIAYDLKKKVFLFWKDKTRPLVELVGVGYLFSEPIYPYSEYREILSTGRLVEGKRFDKLFKRGRKFYVGGFEYEEGEGEFDKEWYFDEKAWEEFVKENQWYYE